MIIRRETLQAALAGTTSDDTRYFLDAVHCEPEKNRVVSTDGHVLLIATDKYPMKDEDFPTINGAEFHGNTEGPVNVPAYVVKAMLGTMTKKTAIPILATMQLGTNGTPTTAIVSATDLSAPRMAKINLADQGQFPNYDRVIPNDDRPTVSVYMAIDVLEAIIKAAKAVYGPKGTRPIRFDVPIGRSDREKNTTKDPETGEIKIGKPGAVCSAVGISINGPDVHVTGCAMPCRP